MNVDADQAPLIELKGVSRRFGKRSDFAARLAQKLGLAKPPATVHAVDNVDLNVRKGEVLGLVGESGCGKSTLGRIVAGIMPPSSGAVMWRGRDRAALSARRAARGAAEGADGVPESRTPRSIRAARSATSSARRRGFTG